MTARAPSAVLHGGSFRHHHARRPLDHGRGGGMSSAVVAGVGALHVHVRILRMLLVLEPTLAVLEFASSWCKATLFVPTMHPDVTREEARRLRDKVFAGLAAVVGVRLEIRAPPHNRVPIEIGIFESMTSFPLFSGLPIVSFGYLEEVLHLRLAAVFVSDCLERLRGLGTREAGLDEPLDQLRVGAKGRLGLSGVGPEELCQLTRRARGGTQHVEHELHAEPGRHRSTLHGGNPHDQEPIHAKESAGITSRMLWVRAQTL